MRFIPLKKVQNNYRICFDFTSSRTFVPIFHFVLCSFCSKQAQEYFLPQGAGYRRYATAFLVLYSGHQDSGTQRIAEKQLYLPYTNTVVVKIAFIFELFENACRKKYIFVHTLTNK